MTDLLFVFKKIITALAMPAGLGLILLALGLLFWKRRWARLPVLAGFLLLALLSMPLASWLLMHHLEVQAGPYASPAALAKLGVDKIVVLSGANRAGDLSKADRLGSASLRVLEGVRLWRGLPQARLVLSGGEFSGGQSAARSMAELAMDLGVPAGAMVLEEVSLDTHDQARELANLLGKKPFALVTAAYHIPRSLEIFRRAGLNPVAAPCNFKARAKLPAYRWFLPNAGALYNAQLALHEHLGRLWYGLRGLAGL